MPLVSSRTRGWLISTLAAAVLGCFVVPAQAGPTSVATVDMTNPAQINNLLAGVDGGTPSVSATTTISGVTATNNRDAAYGNGGLFRETINSINPSSPNFLEGAWSARRAQYNGTTQTTVTTWCLELREATQPGLYELYADVGLGSFVGLPIDNNNGAIIASLAQEKLIRNLFAQFFSFVDSDGDAKGGESGLAARAFQAALWEIVFETTARVAAGGPGTFDDAVDVTQLNLSNGAFTASQGGGGGDSPANTLANKWLSQLSVNGRLAAGIYVLDSINNKDDRQAQIGIILGDGGVVAIVPVPPAIVMAATGLLPLAAYGWRRRKVAQA